MINQKDWFHEPSYVFVNDVCLYGAETLILDYDEKTLDSPRKLVGLRFQVPIGSSDNKYLWGLRDQERLIIKTEYKGPLGHISPLQVYCRRKRAPFEVKGGAFIEYSFSIIY